MMNRRRRLGNILVTGGAGFIGSAFIRYLLSPDVSFSGVCVNLDLLTYAGHLSNLESIDSDPRYLFYQGDISDERLVEHLCHAHAINTIFHFAAESHVDRSITEPSCFIQTNITGTFHLLEVVRRLPAIHFHHVSTDEVYGTLGKEGAFTEASPYRPNSPYAASKAASDHLVRAYHQTYGLSTTLSHCSNNYGPYHFPEKLIPLMILNCLARQPLPLYGDGQQVRDWLHVDDHVRALHRIVEYGAVGETYNIGGEAEWRNCDLVRHIIQIIASLEHCSIDNLLPLITFVPDRLGHDRRYAIDCSKLKQELGWQPLRSFSEGLYDTVQWYRNHLDWVATVQHS